MREYRRPVVNHLSVRCPWCGAGVGVRCVVPSTQIVLMQVSAHPSRIEAAEAAKANA